MRFPVLRILLLAFLLLMCVITSGCGGDASATEIKITETTLSFDPATCKLMKRTFGLGLGSATVEILKRENGICTFEFTHEVEGGYTVYRVEVPTNSSPVEIHAEPDGAEVTTSFNLKKSTVLRKGNMHFE